MERNMDLIRLILLEIEKRPYTRDKYDLQIEGHPSEEIHYHLALLAEAGLVKAKFTGRERFEQWQPVRLTWQGHEFLETVKDEERWARAKRAVIEKGGGLAFTVLAALLKRWVTDAVLGGAGE